MDPKRTHRVPNVAIFETRQKKTKTQKLDSVYIYIYVYFYAKANPSHNHSARLTQFKAPVLGAPTCLPHPRAPWAASSTLERKATLEGSESIASLARSPPWMCMPCATRPMLQYCLSVVVWFETSWQNMCSLWQAIFKLLWIRMDSVEIWHSNIGGIGLLAKAKPNQVPG